MHVRAEGNPRDIVQRRAIAILIAVVLGGTAIGLAITRPTHWWVPAVVGVGFLSYGRTSLHAAWDEWGTVYANLWIASLVSVTGGLASEAFILFTINLVLTAVTRPWRIQVRSIVSAWLFAAGAAGLAIVLKDPDTLDATAPAAVLAGSTLVMLVVGRVIESGVRTDRKLRGVYEQSGELIYTAVLAPTPLVTDVAGAISEVTGLTGDEVRSRPDVLHERMHPDDHERLVLRAPADIPRRVDLRYRWRHADGTWHWWDDRVIVIERDADGRATAVQGVVRDVTDAERTRVALERALDSEQRASADLTRIDRLRTTFLQAVSHELRTPLTAIVGFAETLLRSSKDRPAETLLTERIADNGHELRRLLDDLLDVDRLTRGVDRLETAETDVARLARGQIRSTTLDGRDAVYLGPDVVVADVDAMRVERILSNLLRNAVRYTPSGSRIEVTYDVDGDDLELVVSDDGPGVPDADRERIFAPFEQGEAAVRAPSPGTGIGLALVSELTRTHGGRAWVATSHLGGAAFHVRIPDCVRTAADLVVLSDERGESERTA